jgi:hypothetical protein
VWKCGNRKSTQVEVSDWSDAARALFSGVMDVMRAHMFQTNRPSHLANGAEEWEKYGFGNLAVLRATKRARCCELVLAANAPEVTRDGVAKYGRKWQWALRQSFGCEVLVIFERREQRE